MDRSDGPEGMERFCRVDDDHGAWVSCAKGRARFGRQLIELLDRSLDQGALKDHESRHARSLEKMVPRKRWWER